VRNAEFRVSRDGNKFQCATRPVAQPPSNPAQPNGRKKAPKAREISGLFFQPKIKREASETRDFAGRWS
jgi:hypothetical protein